MFCLPNVLAVALRQGILLTETEVEQVGQLLGAPTLHHRRFDGAAPGFGASSACDRRQALPLAAASVLVDI